MKFSFSLGSKGNLDSSANKVARSDSSFLSPSALGFRQPDGPVTDAGVRKISKFKGISADGDFDESVIHDSKRSCIKIITCKKPLKKTVIEEISDEKKSAVIRKKKEQTEKQKELQQKLSETEGGLIVVDDPRRREVVDAPLLVKAKMEPVLIKQEDTKDISLVSSLKRPLNSRSTPVNTIDYEAMPVEDFGMAMLRGMGFDPKKHKEKPFELNIRAYARGGLGSDKAFANWGKEKVVQKTTSGDDSSSSLSDDE